MPPVNDLCSAALSITSLPYTDTQDIKDATSSAGDPLNAGSAAVKGIWYVWTAPSNMTVVADLRGSQEGTGTTGLGSLKCGAFTGTCGGPWTTVATGSTNNQLYDRAGRIQFAAASGTTYYFHVGGGPSGAVGAVQALLKFNLYVDPGVPAHDLCINAVTIASLPYQITGQNTINATVSVDDPVENLYWGDKLLGVWYKYTPATNHPVRIDSAGSDYETILSIWSTGSCGSLGGELAGNGDFDTGSTINATLIAGTTYYIQVAHGETSTLMGGVLSLNVFDPSVGPPNCFLATMITAAPYSTTVNTAGLTSTVYDPINATAGQRAQKATWFTFTPAATGGYKIDTTGSDFSTILGVYSGGCGVLTVKAESLGPSLSLSLIGGTTYQISMGGVSGGGSLVLAFTFLPPADAPVISLNTLYPTGIIINYTGIQPVFERCTGDLCTGFVTSSGTHSAGTFTQTGMNSGTIYRWRARVVSAITGNSAYSNILTEITPSHRISFPTSGGLRTRAPDAGNTDTDYPLGHPYWGYGAPCSATMRVEVGGIGDRTFLDTLDGFFRNDTVGSELTPINHQNQGYIHFGVRGGYLALDLCVDRRTEGPTFATRRQQLYVSTAQLTPGVCHHVAYTIGVNAWTYPTAADLPVKLYLDGVEVLSSVFAVQGNVGFRLDPGPSGGAGGSGFTYVFMGPVGIGISVGHVWSSGTAFPPVVSGSRDGYFTETVSVKIQRLRVINAHSSSVPLTAAEVIAERDSCEAKVASQLTQIGLYGVESPSSIYIPDFTISHGIAGGGYEFVGSPTSVGSCCTLPIITLPPPTLPTTPPVVIVTEDPCCGDKGLRAHGPEWNPHCLGGGDVPDAADLFPSEIWDS